METHGGSSEVHGIYGFLHWLQGRLEPQGFVGMPGGTQPLDGAFLKQGLTMPYVVGVVDTRHVTNTPKEVYRRLQPWFKKLVGRSGAGLLIFVYWTPPPITTVEEIQSLSGQVIAGAHDLYSGRHWLSNHMGWEQKIYGR